MSAKSSVGFERFIVFVFSIRARRVHRREYVVFHSLFASARESPTLVQRYGSQESFAYSKFVVSPSILSPS